MKALDDLKAVLTGQEGEACITKNKKDLRIVNESLAAIELSLTQEKCPEAYYYETIKVLAQFLSSFSWNDPAVNFLDNYCEPLYKEFESAIKHLKERTPELYEGR